MKIQSLHDQDIKTNLEKLQRLINDKNQIHIYGDKLPVFESYSSTGTGKPSGTFGYSNKSEYVKTNKLIIII